VAEAGGGRSRWWPKPNIIISIIIGIAINIIIIIIIIGIAINIIIIINIGIAINIIISSELTHSFVADTWNLA